jgi:hypothetical protein
VPHDDGGAKRDICRCGHEHTAHEHYRSGTECSQCPPNVCRRFRARRGWLRRLLGRTGLTITSQPRREVAKIDTTGDRSPTGRCSPT